MSWDLSCCKATSISQMRLSLPKINEVIPAKKTEDGKLFSSSWAVADNIFGTHFRAMFDTTHRSVFESEHRCMAYFITVLSPCGVREQGEASLPQNAGI